MKKKQISRVLILEIMQTLSTAGTIGHDDVLGNHDVCCTDIIKYHAWTTLTTHTGAPGEWWWAASRETDISWFMNYELVLLLSFSYSQSKSFGQSAESKWWGPCHSLESMSDFISQQSLPQASFFSSNTVDLQILLFLEWYCFKMSLASSAFSSSLAEALSLSMSSVHYC